MMNTDYSISFEVLGNQRSGSQTFTIFLFRFRRFGCTDPKDRVYAFLELLTDEQLADISPNYTLSIEQVYLETARTLIIKHKHLFVLNCKREPYLDGSTYSLPRIYSTLDQDRFVDPNAQVVDEPGSKPRLRWAHLPDGWDNGMMFLDDNAGKSYKKSPLNLPVPAQKVSEISYSVTWMAKYLG